MAAKRGLVVGSVLALLSLYPLSLFPAGGPERAVRRTDSPEGVRISYEWTDADGRMRTIDLPILRSELEASEQALGFSLADLRSFLIDAELKIRREEGLSAPDIARQVVSRISDPELCRISEDPENDFNFILRTNASALPGGESEVDRVLAAYRRRWEASRKTVCARLQARFKDYAGEHGMEVTPRGIAVDYRRLVRDSAVRLKPLAEEFRRTCGPSKTDLLAAVYSFVQSIPYEQAPPVEWPRTAATATPRPSSSPRSGSIYRIPGPSSSRCRSTCWSA
ncbi:MAG: hypothetical protein NTX99_02255 [Candidatus Aminicenantes bacterium]|nr:hypothetical protein [Candidatus Aminicenantes bacterium]